MFKGGVDEVEDDVVGFVAEDDEEDDFSFRGIVVAQMAMMMTSIMIPIAPKIHRFRRDIDALRPEFRWRIGGNRFSL